VNLPTSELAGLAWSQLWQVTALAVVVGIVTRPVCRRRPHLAYALWMLVLLKCLTPPLWSSPTGLFSWAQVCSASPSVENRLPEVVAGAATPGVHTKSAFGKMLRPENRSAAMPAAAIGPKAVESSVVRAESEAEVDRPEPPRRSYLSWTTIAAAVWLLGVFLLAGNWLWKWIVCSRLLRRSGVPADEELELLAVRTAERLGLRRAVPVRIVSEGVGPAVFGLWRPVVVIPYALVAGTLRVPPPSTSSRSQPGGRHAETSACWGGSSTATPTCIPY
jgi:bla regulator protein blaR1